MSITETKTPSTCNGLCITAAEIGVGGTEQIAFGHPDCPEHGHTGRIDALLHQLATAQMKLERARDKVEMDPADHISGVTADMSSYSRDEVLSRIAAQTLRNSLHLSPDVGEHGVAQGLVARALGHGQTFDRAAVAAGVFIALDALGIRVGGAL